VNKSDIVDVLSFVAAGDRRTVGDADVEMWFLVISDVPKDFALHAVIAHRRDCPGVWLEPGHIVQRWKDHRRDELSREPDRVREARQAELDARLVEAIDTANTNVLPLRFTRQSNRTDGKPNPLSVRCPWCRSGEHRPCQIPGTNVTMREVHPSRRELVAGA